MDSQRPRCRSKNRAGPVRLHKYLALCGVGSRRACERMITAGRVSVDGQVVRRQGICVDARKQVVFADGRPVEPEKKVTILLNKPRDVLCTSADPAGRRTFQALLPQLPERLFTIGRLDRDSEGLLLVTNDGELAFDLTHPRRGVGKVYRVWLDRKLDSEQERRARGGVRVLNETLRLEDIKFVEARKKLFVYEIGLREGRNRHIRKLMGAIGIEVVRLKRIAIGALRLGGLRSGAWRYVREHEIAKLREGAGGGGRGNSAEE